MRWIPFSGFRSNNPFNLMSPFNSFDSNRLINRIGILENRLVPACKILIIQDRFIVENLGVEKYLSEFFHFFSDLRSSGLRGNRGDQLILDYSS